MARPDPDEMERLLREAEADRALARTVPGVAHDLNTLVGIAVTAASHEAETVASLRASLESGALTRSSMTASLAKLDEAGTLVRTNLGRAVELIASLKHLTAGGPSGVLSVVDVTRLLEDAARGLAPLARKSASRVEVRAPESLAVRTDAAALARVVLNLAHNALVHAFEEGRGGTVVLAAEPSDGGAVVTVADDGRGMPPDVEARAFEPHFTTARERGGTGLGLSVARDLVEGPLRGSLELSTGAGRGTTIRLRLPGLRPDETAG